YDPSDDITFIVKGRSLLKGLPSQVLLSESELFKAVEDDTFAIMEAIRKVLEDSPPELVGDIYDNGLLLTGGGALLGGLSHLISRTLDIKCSVAKDAINCVAKGTGLAFGKMNSLLDGFESAPVYKYR
ncbi:MAG: rod shape-determining protein, partial [Ruminococcus sp.]|nr:rod shape-determining protein [Ruminococcus sp.]